MYGLFLYLNNPAAADSLWFTEYQECSKIMRLIRLYQRLPVNPESFGFKRKVHSFRFVSKNKNECSICLFYASVVNPA